jgi:hypothetical protein
MVKALIVRERKKPQGIATKPKYWHPSSQPFNEIYTASLGTLASVKARAGIANRRSSQRRARAVRMQQRHSRPTCSIRADARVAQVIHVPAVDVLNADRSAMIFLIETPDRTCVATSIGQPGFNAARQRRLLQSSRPPPH